MVTAPLLDSVERLGVLELTFASGNGQSRLQQARAFTELVSEFLASKGRVTDELHRLRCVEVMSLAAQMQ